MFPAKRCTFFLTALLPVAAAAHDGDHADMSGPAIALHHAVVPLAIVAAALLCAAWLRRARKRSLGHARR